MINGYWNHRIISIPDPSEESGEYLQISEVYYDADETIRNWTSQGVRIGGSTIEEIRETLERMKRALEAPILKEGELPKKLYGK